MLKALLFEGGRQFSHIIFRRGRSCPFWYTRGYLLWASKFGGLTPRCWGPTNLSKRGRRSKAFEAIFARYRYARMDGTESLLFWKGAAVISSTTYTAAAHWVVTSSKIVSNLDSASLFIVGHNIMSWIVEELNLKAKVGIKHNFIFANI